MRIVKSARLGVNTMIEIGFTQILWFYAFNRMSKLAINVTGHVDDGMTTCEEIED